ncbi:P-loop containing nucleoside triphosphate hydrolase protein [Limtongia smithiae]|uniref:P-loop containing nucleoside triphosphate hydrolase protein n=1 Tax=Limtongia smithiae TaxID=1125753 RepID=UPI0034CEA5D4
MTVLLNRLRKSFATPLLRQSASALAVLRLAQPQRQDWRRCIETAATNGGKARVHEFASFADIPNIDDVVLKGVTDGLKFVKPSGVQNEILPFLLDPETAGSNALVQAKTGTGKTAAFLIPVLQEVLAEIQKAAGITSPRTAKKPIAVIVSPTRELAYQIRDEGMALVAGMKLPFDTAPRVAAIVGGYPKGPEYKNVFQGKGTSILVATPGKLKHYLTENPELFTNVRIKIYDEADRLLDDGFERDIRAIHDMLAEVTTIKQMLMFSATVSEPVVRIAERELGKSYKFVKTVSGYETPTHLSIPQTLVNVESLSGHFEPLVAMLREHVAKIDDGTKFKAIVFVRTGKEVAHYNEILQQLITTIPVIPISSRYSQSKRLSNLKQFKDCASGILIASDVVARGVDIKDVTHVFQLGSAAGVDQYIHRVGRTGRAGKTGKAIVILSEAEARFKNKLKSDRIVFETELDYVSNQELLHEISTAAVERIEILNRAMSSALAKRRETNYKKRGEAPKNPMNVGETLVSIIGFYGSSMKLDRERLHEIAKTAYHIGLPAGEPIVVSSKTLGMLSRGAGIQQNLLRNIFQVER